MSGFLSHHSTLQAKLRSLYNYFDIRHWIRLTRLTLLHKTLKAARLAMADRIVLNCTNTELLAANKQKKWRAQRTKMLRK